MTNTISHILTWVIVAFLGWFFSLAAIEWIVRQLFGGHIADKVTNWLFFAPLILPVVAGFAWLVWIGLHASPLLCYVVTAVIILAKVFRPAPSSSRY